MPSDTPLAPKLVKGALVEMSERFLGPIPNIIVFQFNPETLSRGLTPWAPDATDTGDEGAGRASAATARAGDPTETISLSLMLDASDGLAAPDGHPLDAISGVASRLSALELLTFPQEDSLLGGLVSAVAGALGGSASLSVPEARRGSAPITLFVWGLGRIVPVSVTSFEIEEQQFLPSLYPHRAKVSLGLKVLTEAELAAHPNEMARDIAKVAYVFTKKQREVWGAANLANSVESIMAMLPS